MLARLIAFAAVSALIAVTPRPDSLLVLRNTLRGARRDGIRTASGAAAGSLGRGISSAAGLIAITAASAQLYRAVQLAGAGYLLFLGIKAGAQPQIRPGSSRHRVTGGAADSAPGCSATCSTRKSGCFPGSHPAVHPPHAAVTRYALGYAALDSVIALGWLTALAWVSDRAGSRIRRPRVRRVLDRAAGTILVGLGLKVAAEALSA